MADFNFLLGQPAPGIFASYMGGQQVAADRRLKQAQTAEAEGKVRAQKMERLRGALFDIMKQPPEQRSAGIERWKQVAAVLDPENAAEIGSLTPDQISTAFAMATTPEQSLGMDKTRAEINTENAQTYNTYNMAENRDRNTSSMIGDRAARTGIYGSSVSNANANRDAATALARERQVRSGWGQAPEGYVVEPGTGAGAPIPNVPVAGAPGQPGSGILKPKDYPTAVINAEQSDADAIQTASQLEADTGAWLQRLNSGAIDLGGPQNLASYAMNAVGLGTPETADYQELKAFATRLVNESLRLNKGVQTEGDAQRAANEMLGNLNSPAVVIRQMQVLNLLNRRAVQVRAQAFKERRSRYGLPEFDPMGVTGGMQSSPYAAEPPPAEEMYNYDANGDRLY